GRFAPGRMLTALIHGEVKSDIAQAKFSALTKGTLREIADLPIILLTRPVRLPVSGLAHVRPRRRTLPDQRPRPTRCLRRSHRPPAAPPPAPRTTRGIGPPPPPLFWAYRGPADGGVYSGARRLGADTMRLLDQFRDLFFQDSDPVPPLLLNREFLSDNVIRVL